MVMTVEQLQDYLRAYNNLSGATVTYRTEAQRRFTPHDVVIAGVINIHGNTLFWESDVDLRDLKTRDDLIRLVKTLHASFEKASVQNL